MTTAAAPAAWPSARVAWYTVIVLMVAYILSFIDRVILGLLAGPIRADWGLEDDTIGLLYGFGFAVFYTTVGIPLAWAADRYSRRNIVIVGVALWSLMTAFCGVTKNVGQLALARIGVGVGEATLSPAAYSMAGDLFPPHRLGRALSVFMLGLPLGVGLALIIGGLVIQAVTRTPAIDFPLLGEIRSWQATFILVGLPGIVLAAFMLTLREPARRKALTPEQRAAPFLPALLATARHMLRAWRAYLPLVIGFSVLGMVMNVFQIWGVQHFVRNFAYPIGQAGLSVGLAIAVFGTVGILVGGFLTDRWHKGGRLDSPLRVGLTAAVALVPFASLCTLVPDEGVALAMLAPIGFFTAFAFGAGATGIVMLTPAHMRAQAAAWYLLFVNLVGIGLAPWLTGLLTTRVFADQLAVGKSSAIVAGGAAALASVILAWGRPHFRRGMGSA
jgi:MFS family permease